MPYVSKTPLSRGQIYATLHTDSCTPCGSHGSMIHACMYVCMCVHQVFCICITYRHTFMYTYSMYLSNGTILRRNIERSNLSVDVAGKLIINYSFYNSTHVQLLMNLEYEEIWITERRWPVVLLTGRWPFQLQKSFRNLCHILTYDA